MPARRTGHLAKRRVPIGHGNHACCVSGKMEQGQVSPGGEGGGPHAHALCVRCACGTLADHQPTTSRPRADHVQTGAVPLVFVPRTASGRRPPETKAAERTPPCRCQAVHLNSKTACSAKPRQTNTITYLKGGVLSAAVRVVGACALLQVRGPACGESVTMMVKHVPGQTAVQPCPGKRCDGCLPLSEVNTCDAKQKGNGM